MDRGAWWASVHGVAKESDTTEQLDYKNTEIGGSSDLVAQSCPTLEIPWTLALQTALSMGFPRQKYWSGLPFPSPVERVGRTNNQG